MLIVALVAVCVLVLSGILSAQGNSEDAFERVKEIQERHTNALMAKRGVVGTAVGVNEQGRHALLVLREDAAAAEIPQELEGIPVHEVVTGKIYALPKPDRPPGKDKSKPDPDPDPDPESPPPGPPDQYFERPVPIGVSTGYPDECMAGTIGCRVTDGTNVYALTNNHVYAWENNREIGSRVIQPGLVDADNLCIDDPKYDFGILYDFEMIDFTGGANIIDGAIALVTTADLMRSTPSDGYGMPKSGTARARLYTNVKKYGRTTSLTQGYVAGLNATILVQYGSGEVATFKKQIAIGPGGFSGGGDSGSLIVVDGGKDDRKAVGLLFAGSDAWTFANPITAVLDRFGVSIDGE
jgi:hypothetical protein